MSTRIDWILFKDRKPEVEGKYLISRNYGTWGVAWFEKGRWFDASSRLLYDPIWWAEVSPPKDDRILFRKFLWP